MDLIEKIPEKTIILDLTELNEKDLENIKMYNEKFNNFYVAIHKLSQCDLFMELGIKWYWPFPITSFYELQEISKNNPSYVLLGPPLTFDLEMVKKIIDKDCGIRMVANGTTPQYLLTRTPATGIYGSWVRPEDVKLYEKYVDCLEFEVDYGDFQKEETLLKIYQSGSWPGNLHLLFNDFYVNVDNRIIPEEIGKARMNCGMKCMRNSGCRLCYNGLILAANVRKLKYERDKES